MYRIIESTSFYMEEYGEGIPVVFLHGFHVDHKCFSLPVEKILGKDRIFRRIYPDLPGMGLTETAKAILSTDELFSPLLKFIDTVTEGKPFALAGYSYGGYLARGVLRERADRLLGLFLLCPVIIPERSARTLPPFRAMHKDVDFLGTLPSEERESFETSVVIQTEETYMRLEEEIWEPLDLADHEMMKHLQRQAYGFTEPVDHLALNFSGPVQYLAGRQDSVVGYEDIYSVLNDYPNSELSIINGAGHNLMIDAPDEFSYFLKRWLEKVKDYSSSTAMV